MHIETLRASLSRALSSQTWVTVDDLLGQLDEGDTSVSKRHLVRLLDEEVLQAAVSSLEEVTNASGEPINPLVLPALEDYLSRKRIRLFVAQYSPWQGKNLLIMKDRRGQAYMAGTSESDSPDLRTFFAAFEQKLGKSFGVMPHGPLAGHIKESDLPPGSHLVDYGLPPSEYIPATTSLLRSPTESMPDHLDALERESIRIIRETVAAAKNPGMLFSMGKDSMVMWTLAKKAFWPEPPPIPMVAIDTRWKFKDMYRFRAYLSGLPEVTLTAYINPDAIEQDINPFDQGSAVHTDITKTQALKRVLDEKKFDFVFGGARRDEEKSRAKERIFSLRNEKHGWDPRNQRPELWNTYNTRLMPGESMRVFPLSNWTELDIWRYIERENIELVPLYFAKVRPYVVRNGSLIMVDDERFRLEEGEKILFDRIRFRTLGCYPLTGGVLSEATTVADIISELEQSRVSERSSRVIDFDPGASMEEKKKAGYF